MDKCKNEQYNNQPRQLHITVVGAGYVGLTTGIVMAYVGHSVLCIDNNIDKITLLKKGKAPIYEAKLEEILLESKENLSFSTEMYQNLRNTDIIVIAVGTPSSENGDADMQYVEQVIREIALKIDEGQDLVIVIKSTVPIGSNQQMLSLIEKLLNDRGIKANVNFISNPEFLREGKAMYDSFYPDRIVIGGDNESAISIIKNMYKPLLDRTFAAPVSLEYPSNSPHPSLVITDTASSEMIKYASNAFLATKVSFINEIAGLCEKVGADISDVSIGMGLDSRIGKKFLQAGLGWGGSCFPKDTLAIQSIAREYNYEMPIIEASRTINARQITKVIEKLQNSLKIVRGKKIAVLGLSYKPGTDDVRDSISIEIIKRLYKLGANVSAYDPVALENARKALNENSVSYCQSVSCTIENADAVLIATEWEEFQELNWESIKQKMRSPIVVDGRNILDARKMREMGFIYLGIGR